MAQEQAIPSIGPAAPEFALPHRPGVLRNVTNFTRLQPLGALVFFFFLFMIAMTLGTPKAEFGVPELPHSPLGLKLGQPWLAPYGEEQNFKNANGRLNTDAAPSTKHWLGTDGSGRDNWTRVVWGARRSMFIGLWALALATAIGTVIGVISGYVRGWCHTALQRLLDALQSFPPVLALSLLRSTTPFTAPPN